MDAEKTLIIEIVTPQKTVFSGNAESISLPGSQSPFQVLYNHAPIVSSLDLGLVYIKRDKDNNKLFATSSGFVEVHDNKVSVLVETADDADNLNRQEIGSAIEQLKSDLIKTDNKSEAELIKIKLERSKNQLRAIQSN